MEAKDVKTLEEVVAAGPAGDWPAPTLELLVTVARWTASGERIPNEPVATAPGQAQHPVTPVKGVVNEAVAAMLAQARQRHPDNFWINHTLGYIALEKTRPPRLEEAIRYFSIAIALRPRSPATHLSLSRALIFAGRPEECIAECREAIRLKNDYAEAHNNLGYALRA